VKQWAIELPTTTDEQEKAPLKLTLKDDIQSF